jgi:pimeloyl-ACP methyl ester carboxylesterase
MSVQGKRVMVQEDEFKIPLEFNVVDTEGSGAPVLLLHGFPDRAAVWSNQIHALKDAGFRVIAPDLRGFGDSAKPHDTDRERDVALYRLERTVQDLLQILARLGIDGPVHVVGHDWGAAVGWVLASMVKTRGRVRSLVAMSVGHPLGYKRPTISQREKSWYIYFFQHERAEHAIQKDLTFLAEWSRHPDPQQVERWKQDLARPGALTAALNWYRANASPDPKHSIVDLIPVLEAQGQWTNVQVPTLGIASTNDPHLTPEPMKNSAKFVAGYWRYAEVAAGHWLQLENPAWVTDQLVGFLKPAS